MPTTIDRPVRFAGSEDEARANRATHYFITTMYGEGDGETRCADCDCRPSHTAADYPCGADVPREMILIGSAP